MKWHAAQEAKQCSPTPSSTSTNSTSTWMPHPWRAAGRRLHYCLPVPVMSQLVSMCKASLPEEPVALGHVAAAGRNSRPALRRRLRPRAATSRTGTGRRVLDRPAPPGDGHPAVNFVLVILHGRVVVCATAVVAVDASSRDAVVIGAAARLGVVLGVASCHQGTVPYCEAEARHGGVGLRVAGGFLRRRGGWRRRGSGRRRLRVGHG